VDVMSAHSSGCGSDVGAYALGALTDEEVQRFERHLQTCQLCRTDLASLQPVVDALPRSAEPVEPPAALKKRIMRVVEGEARERERAARAGRERSRRPLLSFGPLPAMAAACLLLLAGVGIGFAVLQDGDDGRGAAQRIAGECIRGCERVAMSVEGDHGTLKVEGMDQPPEGRVYQVWTQRYGQDPEAHRRPLHRRQVRQRVGRRAGRRRRRRPGPRHRRAARRQLRSVDRAVPRGPHVARC
jgi:hypothetical protein